MATFDLNTLTSALENSNEVSSGVDFSGKSLKLDSANDAQPIVDAINACPNLQYLTLTGNTLGVAAAEAIAEALTRHPELKVARFSDMFTGRMKTEIPPALSALGDGMIAAGARLAQLDLSDNAFGPVGVEGLAKLLQSDVCGQLEELRLNNNGLGITGGRLLAGALGARPRRLRVFVAGRNRLENDGAKALAAVFKAMGTLEEVAMPQNGIYHVGVTALSDAFRHNPGLRLLNLNDNTVGAVGAAAIAAALPSLQELKALNLGDCLLKSKGARALAAALRRSRLPVQSVDLSHNEIGRAACMEVVDALTAPPGCQQRLSRVVLAGNSLGSAANKQAMKDKLGAAAALSDGEDDASDDDDVTDSDSEQSESEADESGERSGDESADSAAEDARRSETVLDVSDITLDGSVVEVETDVGRFLAQPTVENYSKLGPRAAELIDAHLQVIKDPTDFIQAYVEATLLVSGLPAPDAGAAAARQMYRQLAAAAQRRHAVQWALADSMLRGLNLIKSENKTYKVRWSLPHCYTALAAAIEDPTFPHALRDTLRFFIHNKLGGMAPEVRAAVQRHAALAQQTSNITQ